MLTIEGTSASNLTVKIQGGEFFESGSKIYYRSASNDVTLADLGFSIGGTSGMLQTSLIDSQTLRIEGVESVSTSASDGLTTLRASRSCWSAYIGLVTAGAISALNPLSIPAFLTLLGAGGVAGIECWP